MMDVAILCGGQGTRLQSAVPNIPKPMVDIHGKPFLEILIERLRHQQFSRFILCTGYMGDRIGRHFKKCEGLSILISQEPKPLGTAGALKHSANLLEGDSILVMNGDSFCPSLDYAAMAERHERFGGLATIAVTAAGERHDGGYISADENGRVLSFAEKTYKSDRYLSAGIYIFDRSLLDRIPEGVFYSLEQDLFPRLSEGFYIYPAEGKVYDIGTPERLEEFRRFCLTS